MELHAPARLAGDPRRAGGDRPALGNWQVGPFRHDWVFVACVLAIGGAYALIARAIPGALRPHDAVAEQQLRAAAAVALGVAVVLGGSLLLRSRAGF